MATALWKQLWFKVCQGGADTFANWNALTMLANVIDAKSGEELYTVIYTPIIGLDIKAFATREEVYIVRLRVTMMMHRPLLVTFAINIPTHEQVNA